MNLASYLDATILQVDATREDIVRLCEEAKNNKIKAICIAPSYVEEANKHLEDSEVSIATVISFPMGLDSLKSKQTEIIYAQEQGVAEIDFVINRSYLANNEYQALREETGAIVSLCRELHLVSKWIVESPLLTEEAFEQVVEIANDIKPNFVKTSTGIYSKATLPSVELLRQYLDIKIEVKASGGIKTREQTLAYIEAGTTRIGTSSYLDILQ